MRRVIVESPYAGDVARNTAYARAAVADCLRRGEAPIASHLLLTQPGILRDEIPEERELGIAAGLAWGEVAERTVAYVDLGISPGMRLGMERALLEGRPIETRSLPEWRFDRATAPEREIARLRHDLANAAQVRVFLEGRVAELEGRPEVPAALSSWFPFVVECLRDYARLLEDGAIDRAGRYLSRDIEKAAETLERAVEPAASGEVCKVCEGIGELVLGLSLESCRAIEVVPCHACRGKPTDPAIAAVVAEERGAA